MSSQIKTVVMLAPSSWPQLGGVQTHIGEISQSLEKLGWKVKILTPGSARPAGKLGLIWLWFWVISQSQTFLTAQVIHIHDVFLWFWPLWPLVKFFNLFRSQEQKIITTFHGWEGTFPPSHWQKLNKWLAQHGSDATVAVGEFISKFYPVNPDLVVYGGVSEFSLNQSQKLSPSPKWIYLGRLAEDTGLPLLLTVLEKTPAKFEFWGDGPLLSECRKLGLVKGWVKNPLEKILNLPFRPQGIIAGGYLAILEALATGQRVVVIANNPLKLDYYQLAPFAKYLTIVKNEIELLAVLINSKSSADYSAQAADIRKNYSWIKLTEAYLKFYEV